MKHKYRRFWLFVQVMLIVLYGALMIAFYYYVGGASEKYVIECSFGALGIFIVFSVKFGNEMLSKYVELFEDSIRFNSFRFRDVKMKPAVSFNMKYEDILTIEARRIPIFGVWAIYVDGKHIPHKITLSFCFEKHKELTRNLCGYVKQYNPEVYIDPRVSEYIEV